MQSLQWDFRSKDRPAEDEVVHGDKIVISWKPVSKSLNGGPINLQGYQVIIEEDVEAPAIRSFFKNEMDVFLPASQTKLTLPREFVQRGTDYKIEVLAIEGNKSQNGSAPGAT